MESSTVAVVEISRDANPFSREGMTERDGGGAQYLDLPESLISLLRGHVEATPDVEAVVELGGERLTYAQLWDSAHRVAGGLRDQGVEPGDRVAIRYAAGTNWVLAFWGTLMAKATVVAVNTRSSEPEVQFVLEDSGVTIDLDPQTPLPSGEPFLADGIGRDDIVAIFYTSGTTGKPKGVPHTHESFLTTNQNMMRTVDVPADMGAAFRTLISVPLFHVTGCNAQFSLALQVGGTSVIMPALDQTLFLSTLADEKITFVVTVPAVYALILRHANFTQTDISSVQWIGYGGSPIAPSLVEALQSAFGAARVFNGYGMTETASIMSVLPHKDAVEHADSVGYAVPSDDLGVIPADPADPTVGELVVRGPNVTTGYWERPEASAESIVDGWLHTGDIVRVDEAGRIFIVDRVKDIIIRGGENVSSIEVEAALVSAPGVLEAAVIAVPDEVMGEKVGAVLFGGESVVEVEQVLVHCRQQLADFKVPQFINVVDTPLPRNAGGKLLKANLRTTVVWGEALR